MRGSLPHRIVVGLTAALVAGLGAVVATASPAQAQAVDVSCGGTLSTTLAPGLLLTPQTITTHNNFIYSPCSSTDEDLTYGTHSSIIVGTFSCLSPMDSFAGSKVITWNTDESSTFEFNSTFSTVGGQFVTVHTGVITAGKFAGDTAVETIVGPTIDFAKCVLPPGITSRSSVVTLLITEV